MTEYLLVYRYEAVSGREFEAVYGNDGAWVALFRAADGYLGTELYRDSASPNAYLVVDRWRTEADFAAFLAERREAYDALDRRTKTLWRKEERVAALTLDVQGETLHALRSSGVALGDVEPISGNGRQQ